MGITNKYNAYCFDEATDTFGTFVQNELDGLKRGKKESDERFNLKRERLLLKLLGQKDKIRYASPG